MDKFRNVLESEQARRVHVCQLRLGKTSPAASARILRKRSEATAWEITSRRAAPAFFAKHTLSELELLWTHRLLIEFDTAEAQAVSIESSIAHFHGSRGKTNPASPALLSEPAIVGGIAKATLGKTKVPWDAWVGNYAEIRDAIEGTYPETKDFNKRLFKPGGFARPLPARERKWVTQSGKANFITPDRLFPELSTSQNADVLHLATLRSNDQFNTSINGYSDRFRGVNCMRNIVFLNPEDIARLGFAHGEIVDLTTAIDEATARTVMGLRVVSYNIPEGCCGAYFPETNPLFPLAHHDPKTKTPSYKLLPVRLSRSHLTLDD